MAQPTVLSTLLPQPFIVSAGEVLSCESGERVLRDFVSTDRFYSLLATAGPKVILNIVR